jgi:pilus assembly protein CpaB
MRLVFGLVLVLGLGLAGFAVYMAKNYIEGYQTALAAERQNRDPGIDTVEVFIATKPLKFGQSLTEEDVKLAHFPKKTLPDGVFTDSEALFPNNNVAPRHLLRSVEPGEAILQVKLTEPGQEAGITSQLDRGQRAFAINVDVTSGVSGFLRPGDFVDVYWTGKPPERARNNGAPERRNNNGAVTRLLEPNVKLIAVDQATDAEMTETVIARTVTVSVRPEQVAALAQAQSSGRLSLSLVGADDDTIANAIEVDQNALFGIEEEQIVEAAPEVKERICTIRTRRGSEVIETPIPCTD